ncbi:hypothetical protein HNY73_002157 [Argiope bruennichi]|uniref:Acyltransferase 3 domain-containing protein n=1 Tax=Argiope bruennichi TaxID=94029 RepID=A0A8T0FSL6_ARGBR|nr:hypothetical protein HNY73_002157 [Argiope bruennichi]
MGSQNDSCEEIPWQASFPILLHNLADKWTKSADTSFRSCQQAPKKLTTEAIFVICVILIFVILNIIGSSINAYESYRKAALLRKKTFRKVKDEDANEDENVANANGDTLTEKKVKATESSTISVWGENGRAFFDCFCIQTNARKIFSLVSKQEHLDYIDGIRAIFFLYIFLSHFLYFYSRSIKNLDKHLQAVLDMPITWYAANSAFGVDAFLTLRIVMLELLRFASDISWCVYDRFACMAYSWFLACIMQLYMISPLFMIPLNRWPRIGYGLSAAAICVSCFSAFIITKQNNLFGCIPTLSESDGLEEINRQLWQT